MLENFATDYKDAYNWTWADWQPYFEALAATELTEGNIEQWLLDWSTVRRMCLEVENRMEVATTVDTTDEEAEARFKNFMATINPEAQKITFSLNKKLVDSGLAPDDIKVPLRNIEAQIRLYDEKNLELQTKLSGLHLRHNKIVGAQTVEWEGEERTLQQMFPILKEPDREKRKKAWLLIEERRYQEREAYDGLWREYMATRKQIYQNAGFNDYREYAWLDRGRFDYTPEDALAFVEAIEETVVPVLQRLKEKDRQALGYDSLRPWDTLVDPHNREPLKAYETIESFIDSSIAIFNQVDPTLGSQFQTMQDEGLLDLDNRKGKGMGGYCTNFPQSKRSFIFMNAVGLGGDVTTLLHEAGHAFHNFAKSELDYSIQGKSPREFNEVAAMAMELLASPYLTKGKGGYFSEDDATRYRIDHLKGIINIWPLLALFMAFQHWIYTHHDEATNPNKCDEKFIELNKRLFPHVDWTGYEHYMADFWRRILHVFQMPFFVIEYGLAQMCAVQVWANSLKDQAAALSQYQSALALGGTVTLPELYATAGGKLAFDSETLGEVVGLVERVINELEAVK